jgi:hypothetical protein
MIAELHVDFVLQGGTNLGYARLRVDLPFAPNTDTEFEHPVWHQPHRPQSVTFSLETKEFFVVFPMEKLHVKDDLAIRTEAYRSHGWEIV